MIAASPTLAQQAAPDPIAATYAQLLGEANGRVAALSGNFAGQCEDRRDAEADRRSQTEGRTDANGYAKMTAGFSIQGLLFLALLAWLFVCIGGRIG